MAHSVFIDKIGRIFNGDNLESREQYEMYKDYSQQGIGRFANKNVYLLDDKDNIISSHGVTKFEGGGGVPETDNYVKEFMLGKVIKNDEKIDFFALDNDTNNSSVLIYKSDSGTFPLISKSKGHAVFHKKNFNTNDIINSYENTFKDICIKKSINFEIK
jgi:hypothetical protein